MFIFILWMQLRYVYYRSSRSKIEKLATLHIKHLDKALNQNTKWNFPLEWLKCHRYNANVCVSVCVYVSDGDHLKIVHYCASSYPEWMQFVILVVKQINTASKQRNLPFTDSWHCPFTGALLFPHRHLIILSAPSRTQLVCCIELQSLCDVHSRALTK